MKHTPKPWHVQLDTTAESLSIEGDPQPIPDYKGNDKYTPIIAIVQDGSFDPNPERLRANARLIAAAPDLLDALRFLLSDYQETLRAYNEYRETADGMFPVGEDNSAKEAREAIAKALGN